ncbi:hypothetical protein JCGZ_19187 [Jatropha curcas]|uniref:Uncharacterized protein n=1 Tax=Jatropha curcas TaxID=180498 RepID=A0A067LIA1_JATCU|nr:hypothetical protein JCGZ_19187 [Jatropha curcas]
MGLASEKDVQVLFDQSDDEDNEVVESGTSGVKSYKANVRIADVPSDIDEGELLNISSMYGVALEYKLVHPFEHLRVNKPLDNDSMMLYEESFRSGFWLPLSKPSKSFFND